MAQDTMKLDNTRYGGIEDVLDKLREVENKTGVAVLEGIEEKLAEGDLKIAVEMVMYSVNSALEKIMIDDMRYCPREEWDEKPKEVKAKVMEIAHFMLLGISQEKLRLRLSRQFARGTL